MGVQSPCIGRWGRACSKRVYHSCMCAELEANGLAFEQQVPISVRYRDRVFRCVYRIDLIIEGRLLIELKTVERVPPVHYAQALTYLKLSGQPQALLINFNVPKLTDGVKSFLNTRAVTDGGGRFIDTRCESGNLRTVRTAEREGDLT